MKVVIVYDIKNDNLRNKLAQELFRYAIRTQKSVFEADVPKNHISYLKDIAFKYSKEDDKVSLYYFNDVKRYGDIQFIKNNDLIF